MICGEDGSGIDHTTLKVTKPFHNSTITMENGFLKIGLFGTDGSTEYMLPNIVLKLRIWNLWLNFASLIL